MAAAGGANNSKWKSGDAWPTREKRRQLAMEGVLEVGESFKFLRRLSTTPTARAGHDEKEKDERKYEKDEKKEVDEEDEKKEVDEEDEKKEGDGGVTDKMEEIPVEELPADAITAQLRAELAAAQEQEELARWQGYQEGVDWALDSVQTMETEKADKGNGGGWGQGKGSGYKGHGHGRKGKPGKGKGKNAHGGSNEWKGGNRPHWAKHKWREAPLPQEKAGAFGTAGAKGTGKGKYDAWGGEYCIGGYRAVSGEFYPWLGFFSWVQVATMVNHLKSWYLSWTKSHLSSCFLFGPCIW